MFLRSLAVVSSTLLAAAIAAPSAMAQLSNRQQPEVQYEPQNVMVGFSFTTLNPQGPFRDTLQAIGTPNVGYGFTLNAMWSPDDLPIALGAGADFIFMGSNERRFRTQISPGRIAFDTVSTQTTFIPISIFARIQPNIARWVYPYAEVQAGINVMTSSTDLRSNIMINTGSQTQSESFSSAPLFYGFGAGVAVKFLDIIDGTNRTSVLLDLGLRYNYGANANYTVVTGFDGSGNRQTVSASSPTDQVTFRAGLSVRF